MIEISSLGVILSRIFITLFVVEMRLGRFASREAFCYTVNLPDGMVSLIVTGRNNDIQKSHVLILSKWGRNLTLFQVVQGNFCLPFRKVPVGRI